MLLHGLLALQNVAEARQLVTLYQYMRLLGYPANRISILTTYNGQKALLREEIDTRCVNNTAVREIYGRPHKVRVCLSISGHMVAAGHEMRASCCQSCCNWEPQL